LCRSIAIRTNDTIGGYDLPWVRRILITGGAGFIGSSLGLDLIARHPDWAVTAFDNLHRRGSEMNLPRLREAGIGFVHGDVREPGDLHAAGEFDTLIECSAEPSALAGNDGATEFVVHTNLLGAYNRLEAAVRERERQRERIQVIFLSTSRVYPVAALNALTYREDAMRFALLERQPFPGASDAGITEQFPLSGARTLYGASKLAAELLVAEYAQMFGLDTVVGRCGVVAGPWQMGKVDQGVFSHWMLAFYFRRPLSYLGFGGSGKQVRDLLHVADLAKLIDDQLERPEHWSGAVVNVGAGNYISLSLRETSALCREITGNAIELSGDPDRRPSDVRIYASDCGALSQYGEWRPQRSPATILGDIFSWIHEHERGLEAALARS
jgi:CDP-paratose 2-epimerase